MSETGRERIVRPHDAFERVDAWLGRLEAGVLVFAMLAMSFTFFLKIVYENAVAERNFVDTFLLRWLHSGAGPAPEALVQQVHGRWSPLLITVGLVGLGLAAVRTVQGQRWHAAGQPGSPPWTLWTWLAAPLTVLGFAAVVFAVVEVPPALVCGALYVTCVAAFAVRARRQGLLGPYLLAWAVLSVPIGWLITRIPAQYAWVNDLAKILIMYIGFIGASLAAREKKHLAPNFGRKLWPTGHRQRLEAVNLFVTFLFLAVLLALACHLFQLQWQGGSSLAILWVPEWHIVLPLLLGLLLMAVRFLADFVRVVRGRPLARVELDFSADDAAGKGAA